MYLLQCLCYQRIVANNLRVHNMSAAAETASRSLFRDRDGAIANTIVLLWVSLGWIASFAFMGANSIPLNVLGVGLCAHTMILAAYLIHEAAHQTLFAILPANAVAGEATNFIAGSSYASFERIRHLHIRHHMDRADVACFDFKALMLRHPALRRSMELLEWCYIPAVEILMHLQVVWRPLFSRSQRRYLLRSMAMLAVRGCLLALLGLWSVKALVLYFLAVALLLHVLNFFDAFHHTYEQIFVEFDQPVPSHGRDRAYEEENTYSNLLSARFPWLDVLILNFGYHNAHHQRASVPWFRLPRFHRSLYGDQTTAVMPLSELLRSWHCNRVRRVISDGSRPGQGAGRADVFVGAHGVSFLTAM
jgi:fatty acid desaturase